MSAAPALRAALLLALSLTAAGATAAQSFTVPQELWDRPRTADAVLKTPALRQAMAAYLAQDGGRIVIHYGPGQEAHLDAEELRSWLIALAVEGGQVSLNGDLSGRESLKIEVMP